MYSLLVYSHNPDGYYVTPKMDLLLDILYKKERYHPKYILTTPTIYSNLISSLTNDLDYVKKELTPIFIVPFKDSFQYSCETVSSLDEYFDFFGKSIVEESQTCLIILDDASLIKTILPRCYSVLDLVIDVEVENNFPTFNSLTKEGWVQESPYIYKPKPQKSIKELIDSLPLGLGGQGLESFYSKFPKVKENPNLLTYSNTTLFSIFNHFVLFIKEERVIGFYNALTNYFYFESGRDANKVDKFLRTTYPSYSTVILRRSSNIIGTLETKICEFIRDSLL